MVSLLRPRASLDRGHSGVVAQRKENREMSETTQIIFGLFSTIGAFYLLKDLMKAAENLGRWMERRKMNKFVVITKPGPVTLNGIELKNGQTATVINGKVTIHD